MLECDADTISNDNSMSCDEGFDEELAFLADQATSHFAPLCGLEHDPIAAGRAESWLPEESNSKPHAILLLEKHSSSHMHYACTLGIRTNYHAVIVPQTV